MTTASNQSLTTEQLDQLCINTIRMLSADGVQQANSGHPGMPMGMAAIAYTLWTRHMNFSPKNPNWFNRDRFMLSNGHGSMLQYSLLHLTGFDLPLEQLKRFRQWGSKTAGHPERGLAPGIEVTTGPLGQGVANGLGMGIAEAFLGATYNRDGHDLIDHHTYVFMGDGCMQEGIASEAASLIGHLQLGKLIYFYDDNQISIDGDTDITFTENVGKRFEAYGWNVIDIKDGTNDIAAIDAAITAAKQIKNQPTLIIAHTIIGFGSPNKAGSAKTHGNPLGKEEVIATKEHLGFPSTEPFFIPEEALAVFRAAGKRGDEKAAEWDKQFEAYKKAFPIEGKQLEDAMAHRLPDGWDKDLPKFEPKDGPLATRMAGSKALNAIAAHLPTFIGGSADLNESTFTKQEAFPEFGANDKHGVYRGKTINWGIREHAMGAAVNGMAAHGGVYPYGATFFVFSDYMRPAVRLSALMRIPSIFVWTHDSVAVGEDGPTHEPIEQLMSLRLIPGLTLIRPAEATETVEAWRMALQSTTPVGLVLTRQKLPILDRTKYPPASNLAKGAYILSEAKDGKPEFILIATGSEVQLALDVQPLLEADGISTRVVSMPSWEFFTHQSQEYRDSVLPDNVGSRLSLELGVTTGWDKWVGSGGASFGVDHFGASSPYETILKEFGFTPENIAKIAKMVVKDPKAARQYISDFQKSFDHLDNQ